jgi:hypothetical protein
MLCVALLGGNDVGGGGDSDGDGSAEIDGVTKGK